MKKKILVFSQTGVGGAERMSVTITKTLDREEFELKYYLVGTTMKGKAPLEAFIPNYFSVKYIKTLNPIRLLGIFFCVLIKEKPSVVFASVINLNNKLLLLKKIFPKIKFIIRCDNYLYTYTKKQQKIISKTYRLADNIIAQTDEMKQELVDRMRIANEKIVVLHNPVDIDTITQKINEGTNPYPQNGKIHYVACGRFAYQKGFDLLVKSFAEVKKHIPNTDLYILGKNDGNCSEFYEKVKKSIERLGLEESVHCVGYQINPYVYIKNADCFVLSSRWEGLPNVLIEALYLGVPIASFKCIPIIERIVKEGSNGFLAEKEDIKGLASSMIMASNLGSVFSEYKPATIGDFHKLFY